MGNYHDNTIVETVFKIIKAEQVRRPNLEAGRVASSSFFQSSNCVQNTSPKDSAWGAKAPQPSNAKRPKQAIWAT
jgi:hypothetical protein